MSKVSEPCSPKLRACVDALIADGKPEASAWAICKAQLNEKLREAKTANVCGTCNWVEDDPKEPLNICPLCGAKAYYVPVLHPQEGFKHPDFQKIQTQFIKQCGKEEGLRRYNEWVDRLGLDESKSYLANAQMREKFQWIQRHADFRLWKEDRDAKYWRVEAGFPLQSMNENVYTKEELTRAARTIKGKTVNLNHKFSLPTVEILAGEYESDIVECVMRVPNSLHCPICDRTKTINDLIESQGIVNVSLEAACDYGTGPHGECEGMNFTGLSLLTKDVLPGIPLTRLMPLESIMVEALQVNETKTEVKRKVKKLEMKIVTEPKEAEQNEPGQRDLTPTVVMPDEHGQCPEGMILNTELGQCVKSEGCPEGQHFDQKVQQCVPDAEEDSGTPETAMGISVENALLDEKVGRLKAEDKATNFEEQALIWQKRFRNTEAQLHTQVGTNVEQRKTIERQEKQVAERDLKAIEEGKKLSDREQRLKDAILSRDDYKTELENLKLTHEALIKKYHETLSLNLDLSRKLTMANEDYLKVAKEKDDTEEALKRSKIQAKKIIRIQA